ncbi:MAG: ArnT family glycosyltransferase [Leadbetterella sp.]
MKKDSKKVSNEVKGKADTVRVEQNLETSNLLVSKRPVTEYIIILCLLLAGFWLFTYTYDRKIMMVGDDTDYVMLAKAIHSGKGYSGIMVPTISPYKHFPPGYPYFLNIMMYFTDTQSGLKHSGVLLVLITVFCTFFFLKKVFENIYLAGAVTFLFIANPLVLTYSNAFMSEMLFVTLVSVALYFFSHLDYEKVLYKQPYLYLSVLFVVASYYTRTVGLMVLGGMCLHLLFNKKWIEITLISALFFVLILPWNIRNSHIPGKGHFEMMIMKNSLSPEKGNMETWADWKERIGINIERYTAIEIPTVFKPSLPEVPIEKATSDHWMWGYIFVFLIIGGLFFIKNFKWLVTGVIASTFALLFIYPDVWVGNRLMFHLIPLFFISMSAIVPGIVSRFKPDFLHITNISLAVVLVIIAFTYKENWKVLHQNGKVNAYSKPIEDFIVASEWIKANTSEKAFVTNRKPSILYYYSGRYSHEFPRSDIKTVMDYFERQKITHAIVDGLGYASTYKYLAPALNAHMDKFKLVYRVNGVDDPNNPDTYVFEYLPNQKYLK